MSKIYNEIHMMCILHTARISDVNGIMFVTSWGLRIFFPLSHARDKTKNIFLHFFTKLKTYHLSYFYLKTQSCLFRCCDVYFFNFVDLFVCLFCHFLNYYTSVETKETTYSSIWLKI